MSTCTIGKILLAPTLFASCLGMALPNLTSAAPNDIVRIEGMAYRVDLPLVDNLKALKGKKVTLHLKSGTQIHGRVKRVHKELLHLEKIQQREFMDALIRMEQISAVEARFRAYERDLKRLQR